MIAFGARTQLGTISHVGDVIACGPTNERRPRNSPQLGHTPAAIWYTRTSRRIRTVTVTVTITITIIVIIMVIVDGTSSPQGGGRSA